MPTASNTVELISFDIREQLPGWSFIVEAPQITEEVLRNNIMLFYLESEDNNCKRLPLNNVKLGYKASVYKNVGKVYVTFKSLKDGVSHFYVPTWHLNNLKILIIKSKDKRIFGDSGCSSSMQKLLKGFQKSGINVNHYEDVLMHLSNIASIDYKGHYTAKFPERKKIYHKKSETFNDKELYTATYF